MGTTPEQDCDTSTGDHVARCRDLRVVLSFVVVRRSEREKEREREMMLRANNVVRRVTGTSSSSFVSIVSGRTTQQQQQPAASVTLRAASCAATASAFATGAGLSCARRTIGAKTGGRGTALIVEANAKRCLGSTKGGTNRHRKRTSGFRVRKRSATGSKVLKNRRKKGRKQLAPASKHSGKK